MRPFMLLEVSSNRANLNDGAVIFFRGALDGSRRSSGGSLLLLRRYADLRLSGSRSVRNSDGIGGVFHPFGIPRHDSPGNDHIPFCRNGRPSGRSFFQTGSHAYGQLFGAAPFRFDGIGRFSDRFNRAWLDTENTFLPGTAGKACRLPGDEHPFLRRNG